MLVKFSKYVSHGNHYLLLSASDAPTPDEALVRKLTHPQYGILADGIIMISNSTVADAKMVILNKDGSRAFTCGNGLRMVGAYLLEHSNVKTTSFTIETDANIATVHLTPDTITVNLNEPLNLKTLEPLTLKSSSHEIEKVVKIQDSTVCVDAISMGNPHYILYTLKPHEAIYELLEQLSITYDVNVGVVTIMNDHEIALTTYERGAGFTGACGTNTAAAVTSATLRGFLTPDFPITIHLPKGELTVQFTKDAQLLLSSPVIKVCDGTLYLSQETDL